MVETPDASLRDLPLIRRFCRMLEAVRVPASDPVPVFRSSIPFERAGAMRADVAA